MTALDDRSAPVAYRLSRERLADLATGGDRPETVRFLAETQYSRRLLLLYELRNRASAGLGPLPPVDDAWDAMQRAQAHDPTTFESVVMHPQIGNWAAYAVRRHLDGDAGEPSWFDLGQIHAVALVAAARAGQSWHTRVPLRDGRATLPGLGQARFGAAPPRAWAAAETACGQIRLSYRDVRVDVPEDPCRDGDGWWGLRCLSAGDGPVLRVVLDDLDFFRNLADPVEPERLTGDEVDHWQLMLERAWDLLCRDDRTAARALALAVSSLAPLARADQDDEYEIRSASSAEAFGAVVLSTPHDAADFAATLVHEGRHIKLGCLMHLRDLHTDDGRSELYAPWRDDPRPLGGLLQGVYAFHGIAAFYRNRAGVTEGAERRSALYTYALTRSQTAEGLAVARASGLLTALGREFFDRLAETMYPWFDDDLPADIVRLAGLATGAHRTTWLLRHRRPAAEAVTALADAWTAGGPIDRTATGRAVVEPPAETPEMSRTWSTPIRRAVNAPPPADTPEPILIAGDAERARVAFARRIESDPGDLVAWTGLALACAEAGATEAAYALAGRPDLIAAAYRLLRARGAAPAPEALAAWAGLESLGDRWQRNVS